MADSVLLDEFFQIQSKDYGSSVCVSRLKGVSTSDDLKLTLDVHELFRCEPGHTIQIHIANSADNAELESIAQYIMQGKIYKVDESSEIERLFVYASFGGLLMCIEGPAEKLSRISYGKIACFCTNSSIQSNQQRQQQQQQQSSLSSSKRYN